MNISEVEILSHVRPDLGPKDFIVLVDAHVHIHACFELTQFFSSASKNFKNAALCIDNDRPTRFMLCLTETADSNIFQQLAECSIAKKTVANGWNVAPTEELCSLTLQHDHYGALIVVGGRQIVCAEKLEVLALGLAEPCADGEPIKATIDHVRQSNAIAILPWGFGKWLGKRGRILRNVLAEAKSGEFFLGDNGGRLASWPLPSEFSDARSRGIEILPGTDPLPFPRDVVRAGAFGFKTDLKLDGDRPFASLARALLSDEHINIEPYGKLENPIRFVRNQIAMQLRKYH